MSFNAIKVGNFNLASAEKQDEEETQKGEREKNLWAVAAGEEFFLSISSADKSTENALIMQIIVLKKSCLMG
jgi:hypothetical protein